MTILNETVNDGEEHIDVDGDDSALATEHPKADVPEGDSASSDTDAKAADDPTPAKPGKPRIAWPRAVAYGMLPGLILLLALGAGYLKWVDESARSATPARAESLQVAKDGAVALLSYRPETVERDLGAASERLTGDFKGAYQQLTHDVVIPGAKQKNVTAIATVAAAASVSATDQHAVALVFVDQTVTVGTGAPTGTTSVLRVVLDKVHGRWLISRFDPV